MAQQEFDRLESLDVALHQRGIRRLLVIADVAAVDASGAAARLQDTLRGIEVVWFREFSVNPQLADAMAGMRCWHASPPDALLAIGGGTAIDVAKLIRCFVSPGANPDAIVTGSELVQPANLPLIAVPTTAGTGSEATPFAVVYREGQKYSVAHKSLLPEVVVLDASLTASMPPRLTASTGLDAMTQAIESSWSMRGTVDSCAWASSALALAWNNLVDAVHRPDPAVRLAMLRAANLAGKAIGISQTTAPHALSYHLTSKYGVPHGMAVALFLGPLLRFNAAVTPATATSPMAVERMQQTLELLERVMQVHSPGPMVDAWESLLRSLDCPSRLHEVGVVGDAAIATLVDAVNLERLANNPRRVSRVELITLLNDIA